MQHTYTISLEPVPLADGLRWQYRLVFDHGAEMVVLLTLVRGAGGDPDKIGGSLHFDSEVGIQDHTATASVV